jgi:BirA family biotin operon repressor/biotin-[acetyl-CoA-carboxylase] ligase
VFEIRTYAETASTNDDALALLAQPEEAAGVVLVADYQSAGRGRKARPWVAPPGSSLLATAILPRRIPHDALWAVTFWTALAVADGIEAATGIRVELQWPNDLLIDGRKCCGILCVSRVTTDGAWVGCGTGINVTRPAASDAALEALAAIAPPPAFLSDHAPIVERGALLAAILAAYERRLDDFTGALGIARAWERRAGLLGTPYRLQLDDGNAPFDAIAKALDPGGALIVESGGVERRIALADARVLRA